MRLRILPLAHLQSSVGENIFEFLSAKIASMRRALDKAGIHALISISGIFYANIFISFDAPRTAESLLVFVTFGDFHCQTKISLKKGAFRAIKKAFAIHFFYLSFSQETERIVDIRQGFDTCGFYRLVSFPLLYI